jgi:hypothetical protein
MKESKKTKVNKINKRLYNNKYRINKKIQNNMNKTIQNRSNNILFLESK